MDTHWPALGPRSIAQPETSSARKRNFILRISGVGRCAISAFVSSSRIAPAAEPPVSSSGAWFLERKCDHVVDAKGVRDGTVNPVFRGVQRGELMREAHRTAVSAIRMEHVEY